MSSDFEPQREPDDVEAEYRLLVVVLAVFGLIALVLILLANSWRW